MKKLLTLITLLSCATISFAQSNTIAVPAPKAVNLGDEAKWIPLFIQGVITTNFQQYSGMKVVDRQNADMVKAEQKLSENAAYDENNAIELGKLTSAKLIITGSITGKSNSYALMFSITDAETGETKASATVPNCLFSALENGDAANQISYDLMKGYGIKLDAIAQSNLTKKATVMSGEVAAQASVAKGIVAEQSGSNIEALTYYIQAKKNDKKLGEATSRMASMTSVVTTGNFGANAKNLMKLRNDWDKLLRETAELIASNPPQFVLKYFSDIEAQELTEEDYENGTMSFAVSSPYIKQVVDNENGRIATELLTTLKAIPQSKNWGDKINFFPWSYADDIGNNNWLQKSVHNTTDTFSFKVSLLDAKKKEIAKKTVKYTVEYTERFTGFSIKSDNLIGYDDSELFIFKAVPVNDADTDKLYITITNNSEKNISIVPVEKDVLPIRKAIECIKSGNHNGTIKIAGIKYYLSDLNLMNKKEINTLDFSDLQVKDLRWNNTRHVTLSTLILPDTCYEIDYEQFSDSNITSLIIPASVKKIHYEAFYQARIGTIFYCGSENQWNQIQIQDSFGYDKILKRDHVGQILYDSDPNDSDLIKVAEKLAAEKKAEEKRIAAEKKAEAERIAAEKIAEEERIAAEKQRLKEEQKKAREERIAAVKKAKKLQDYYDSGVVPAEYAAEVFGMIDLSKDLGYIKKLKITGNVANKMGKIRDAASSNLNQKQYKYLDDIKLRLSLDLSEAEGLTILDDLYFKQGWCFIQEITLPSSLVEIKDGAFFHWENPVINYTGTKKQWKKIKIDKKDNETLLKAKINYNYKPE